MIKVKTFLKNKIKIKSINDVISKPQNFFVECNEDNIKKYVNDFDYIEGAVVIYSNGKKILGYEHRDLVYQEWYYIIENVDLLIKTKNKVSFEFPDQPLNISFEYMSNNNIIITVEKEKYVVNKDEFIFNILKEGKNFFEMFKRGILLGNSEHMINKINKIEC